MLDCPNIGEKAILIHMDVNHKLTEDQQQEFVELAHSANANVFAAFSVKRTQFDPKYCLGSGKALELKQFIADNQIQLVLFNLPLAPTQQRNLEQLWQIRVIDRMGLILDIFAQRARTHEGKLQVELAQLEYLSTRLVRGWTHLERQKGGIGLRGPGETQLETDRRLIRNRATKIKQRLLKVRKQRTESGKARKQSTWPIIALVGYTNAGKSTLFNRLSGSNVYAKDQLFATLDPTLRKVWLGPEQYIIIADTVGFIRDLPHELIDAFRATLEEVAEADVLLHIIDASATHYREQRDEVYHVLNQINADQIPVIEVYNKIDQMDHLQAGIKTAPQQERLLAKAYCSALSGTGIDELRNFLKEIRSLLLPAITARFTQPSKKDKDIIKTTPE